MTSGSLHGRRREQDGPHATLDIAVDRTAQHPLTEQIASSIRSAILEGRIPPASRLPSWRDLATQLGVARGTVRAAYEQLADSELVFSAGSAGTWVARRIAPAPEEAKTLALPLQSMEGREYYSESRPFQMGIPAQDAFPTTQWRRMLGQAARDFEFALARRPDPRGIPELREQIAAYLAIARGIRCLPDQVVIISGYRGNLGLVLAARGARGEAWMEDPGYPVTRAALKFMGFDICAVPVDEDGIDVARGVATAPNAVLAVVTPGQQCPLGVTLSEARRDALVDWASEAVSWVLEDDYLSELQLDGRVPPAVASTDPAGVVFHSGTFSKTLGPAIGLGFLVSPLRHAEQVADVAAHLAPSPAPVAQLALADFMRQGHYLRHLRRMKKLYLARRDALMMRIEAAGYRCQTSGLAVLIWLPEGCDDVAIAQAGVEEGLALAPLSPWFSSPEQRRQSFLLGITNLTDANLARSCEILFRLIERSTR